MASNQSGDGSEISPPISTDDLNLREVLELEKQQLQKRRIAKGRSANLEEDSMGIALSGGGIRSATICLGILKVLNQKGLLANADYLSTVSGGGYLGAYLHTALNDEKPLDYQDLFAKEDIAHLRDFREYLYLSNRAGWIRMLSKIHLGLIALWSMILGLAWLWVPAVFLYYQYNALAAGEDIHLVSWGIAALLMLALGILLSPNRTSPHWYYKRRLSKAYLSRNRKISLKDLKNPLAPYPLINAAVHVNYDAYRSDKISYRGRIESNYFLFSPWFCGSQVTGYVATDSPNYKHLTLATAMATSAAAVNTFMGNQNLSFVLRQVLSVLNLRTGILASNPQLNHRLPVFWPYYTLLEMLGKPETNTYKVQVSDGGHIENLAIYELLRRKVKVIIAIDAGQDSNFEFSDLRNLVVRANSELGIRIHFPAGAEPQDVIRPNAASGFSQRHFTIARISTMKGAYAEPYEGLLIYIKSSVLENQQFELRSRKRALRALYDSGKGLLKEQEKIEKRRTLDAVMYETYNPDFPHESTADQFFDEAQWDAYHRLGQKIGERFCRQLDLEQGEDGQSLFQKGLKFYQQYEK